MRVVVVIPTFQEADNIGEAIRRLRAAVPDAGVLVVDDNSPDGTADLADAVAAELGDVEVFRRPVREGLGRAYVAGWSRALDEGAEVVVSMDADGSHDPAVLPTLLEAIDGGADMVMGSRYIPGGAVPGWPIHRLMLSKGGNRYAALMLGIPLRDATGGYRAYRADLLRRIDLSTIRANGYAFQIEQVRRAMRVGAKIVEVPITFVDRRYGISKMHAGIIWEALGLVTWWGIRDRFRARS
jgi:dolichol-phosphate mannosyltransferase